MGRHVARPLLLVQRRQNDIAVALEDLIAELWSYAVHIAHVAGQHKTRLQAQ